MKAPFPYFGGKAKAAEHVWRELGDPGPGSCAAADLGQHVAGDLITHCKHGHEFTEANTVWNPNGTRKCRECRRRINAEHKARRARAEHERETENRIAAAIDIALTSGRWVRDGLTYRWEAS